MLDWLEKRLGNYAVPRLINLVVMVNTAFYLMAMANPRQAQRFLLDRDAVMAGEVWRLFTHVVAAQPIAPIWMFFEMYLLWLFGNALEQEWGAFKLNVFYFSGAIATTIAGLAVGGASMGSIWVNTSVFLAFATLFPDFELLLFFILPVKVKWLALITTGLYAIRMIEGPWVVRAMVLAGVANYLLFFWRPFFDNLRHRNRRERFRRQVAAAAPETFHRCTACGKTEKDDPKLEFRVCTDCEGGQEYCLEHLDHAH